MPQAWSYPSTISHGYAACATCHYNPYGNGPLTDYGRALSATVMSARPPFSRATDEELAENSGFLGRQDRLPDWLRFGASFRGMVYASDLTRKGQSRFIPMQLEATAIYQSKSRNHQVVATMGYAPDPATTPTAKRSRIPNLISREHYWSYRASRNITLLSGLVDTAFGTRVPDHIAVHRKYTSLAQNDQTHGVLLYWTPKPWQVGFHLFLGNLYQKSALRHKGGSLILERLINDRWMLGTSLLHSKNDYRTRQMLAVHSRSRHGEGNAVLAEIGLVRNRSADATVSLANYIFLQPSLELARGLQFLTTFEYYTTKAFESEERFFRVTPGIQYFPMQRVEFRFELQTSRYLGQGVVNGDIYSLMSQVHLWL